MFLSYWISPKQLTKWNPVNTVPGNRFICILFESVDKKNLFRAICKSVKIYNSETNNYDYFWIAEDDKIIERSSVVGWQELPHDYEFPTLHELRSMIGFQNI